MRFARPTLVILLSVLCGADGVSALPSVDAPLATGASTPMDYAVVIGIERYGFLPKVDYAERDADAFAAFARTTRGIPSGRIHKLIGQPSRAEILIALDEAGRSTSSGGVVWVYFSGHGAADPTTAQRVLLPVETTKDTAGFQANGIPTAEVERRVTSGGGRMMLITDACFGGAGRDRTTLLPGGHLAISIDDRPPKSGSSWVATQPNEVAGPLAPVEHGAFTYVMLGALRGWADGALDNVRDGTVTSDEADAYVGAALRELGVNDQRPKWSGESMTLVKGKLEVAPALPRVSSSPTAAREMAAPVTHGTNFGSSSSGSSLAQALHQAECHESAARLAESTQAKRLDAESRRVQAEAASAWSTLASVADGFLRLSNAQRGPVIGEVESLLFNARGAVAEDSGGFETVTPTVPSGCAAETVPLRPRSVSVPVSNLTDAEHVLAALRDLSTASGGDSASSASAGAWSDARDVTAARIEVGTPTTAVAVLPSTALIEVLPVAGIAGDGHTQIALDAVLRTRMGAPIMAAKLKATVSLGSIGEVAEVGDGVYTATFTPPKVDAPTTVVVSFKGRTAELGAVEATRVIAVGPALEGRITVTSSQPAVTLGTDANVTLSFAFPAAAGEAATAADLDIRTSSGTVSEVVSVGAGRFSARFTPPAVNFPHLAVITVVDRRNPGRVWGTFSLPLQGKVDYPVTAPPGANVVLRLAGKEYGPSRASAAGRASVPIIVPPGLNAATQVVSQGSSVTESTLDLRVPDGRRIELFSVPASVPSDSRAGVPIRVVVTKGDGTPDVSAQLSLTTSAGRLTEPRHAGNGVYVATFTPPDGRTQMAATIQASIGGSSAQADSLDIALIRSLPSRLDLSAEPTSLAADTTGLKIYASLTAADGTGLPGRSLRIGAAGATQKGDVVDLKGGDYRADFSTNGNTDVFVRVVALAPASANPVRRVVLLPAFTTVAPGGAQPVVIVTTDEFGYPVPNVDVTLAVVEGGGTAPNSVTTDAHGIAEIVYHAGAASGLAALEARSGGASTAVSFYQSTGTLAPLPVPGSPEDRAVTASWRASASAVIVDREGGGDAPVGSPNRAR